MKEIKVGDKFGYLEVIEPRQKSEKRESWLCRCVCGTEKVFGRTILIGNKSTRPLKSCGCRKYTHNGLIGKDKKLHDIWYRMTDRCLNEKSKVYKYYGGKGVKICEEWRVSYESFYIWALNNGYKENLTLDRIDSSGDYMPENCRWVDWYAQAQNKGIMKNNKTGVPGAKLEPNGRYHLKIMRDNTIYNLGMYDTIEEAASAREIAISYYEENGTLDSYKPTWKRLRNPRT